MEQRLKTVPKKKFDLNPKAVGSKSIKHPLTLNDLHPLTLNDLKEMNEPKGMNEL